jgi:hypothetical protein
MIMNGMLKKRRNEMMELHFKVISVGLEGERKLGNMLTGLWTKV